jgi:hypothetical protein
MKHSTGKFDLVVGFNKLASLDILYCSDRPMQWRAAAN